MIWNKRMVVGDRLVDSFELIWNEQTVERELLDSFELTNEWTVGGDGRKLSDES